MYINDGMDPEEEIEQRLAVQRSKLKKDTMLKLQEMLKNCNPYVKTFKCLADMPEEEISDFKFILSSFENQQYPKQSKKLRKVKYFKYLNFPVNPIN